MRITRTPIPGMAELIVDCSEDDRGRFAKVYRQSLFSGAGLETSFVEQYYTTSAQGVIRGLHFQEPPSDHVKVVYCSSGAVVDVVVDLRVGSPVYGIPHALELSYARANALYLPQGVAHGFCTPYGPATLNYMVSTEYDPSADAGVRWDSIGFDWPVEDPILSERDRGFVALGDYASPFILGG